MKYLGLFEIIITLTILIVIMLFVEMAMIGASVDSTIKSKVWQGVFGGYTLLIILSNLVIFIKARSENNKFNKFVKIS